MMKETIAEEISMMQRVRTNVKLMMLCLSKVLFYSSFLCMILLIIYYSLSLYRHGSEAHLIAWFSAGAFVIMGFPISMYGILGHLRNYERPDVQCYVVRILWMVPIYSVESWLCLRFHEHEVYIATLRDCYESYVIYCFFSFLIAVLGGEEKLTMMLKDKSPTRGFHLSPVSCCVKPWIMGQPVENLGGRVKWTSPFFLKCKLGVFQYVLIKLLTALSSLILELVGLYHEGDFSPTDAYPYITFIANLSQCWALYCLAFFYFATKNELSHIRPVGKFMCVKALIFFTWWQSVGVSVLFSMGLIPDAGTQWTKEDVAKGIQDYLICIEMFAGAIAHQYVFHWSDYSRNKNTAYSRVGGGRGTRRRRRRA